MSRENKFPLDFPRCVILHPCHNDISGGSGEPEDLVGSVIEPSSGASTFMTGAIVALDGEYLAR